MSLEDILRRFRGEKTVLDRVVALPDPEAGAASEYDQDNGEYFQVRLSEMYLTDKRRWHQEIAPAAFVYADFKYGGQQVRRPFFVSNALVSDLPMGADAKTLRIRFSNTSVVGPVPYEGGDVDLFVGLFQTTLVDWRKITFNMLEKVFAAIGPNPVSPYLRSADGLTGDLLACLGQQDVKCILANRQAIGQHAIPQPGYLAYLRHTDEAIPDNALQVHEGRLKRSVDGALRQFDDTDYCLVRIQRLATRNDYASMPFHQTWQEARKKAIGGDSAQAQGLMLDCARQILASAELTEGDKEHLIGYYQDKLHETGKLLAPAGGTHGANRAGAEAVIGGMRKRALAVNDFESDSIRTAYDHLARVATVLAQQEAPAEVSQADLETYLRQARSQRHKPPAAETLVRALTLGSVTGPA